MTKNFTKDEIETIILQAVLSKPAQELNGCKIYPLEKEGEELVIKNMQGTQEVTNLTDLETAIGNKEVARIYIPKFSSITSKGMKNVLSRVTLAKNIYCAFKIDIS